MEKERATELACRQSLDISDWLEITDVPIGQCDNYLIGTDGVRFHPNGKEGNIKHGKKEDSEKPFWSEEQIREALPSYWLDPDESKVSAQQRMLVDNTSLLLFPCTPRQLVEFVLKHDASGDLHGSLPGRFIAAVYEYGSLQQSCQSELEDLRRQLELERTARQDAEQRAKQAEESRQTLQAEEEKPLERRERASFERLLYVLAHEDKYNLESPYLCETSIQLAAEVKGIKGLAGKGTIAKYLKAAVARVKQDQQE